MCYIHQRISVLAKNIDQYSLAIVILGKQTFYQQIEMAEKQAYEYAKEVISGNALTDNALEYISAFLEKRSPVWKDK